MRPHRKVILVLAIILTGGSLGFTTVYGLRIGSDSHRRQVEQEMTAFFELPCEVGRISARTFASRGFEDVVIYLKDRRDRVFFCETAVWHDIERRGEPASKLELLNGLLLLGSDKWQGGDYHQLIQAGLGHDFEALDLDEVTMSGFEIAFARGSFSLLCRDVSGSVDLSDSEEGVARLNAYELNGLAVPDGVRIHARFSPRNGVEVSELILSLPEVPLASVGLSEVLGGRVSRGRFAGRVQYLDGSGEERPEIWVRGDLVDADLAELTQGLPLGPFEGTFSVNVHAARVSDSIITHFQGRGRIRDLSFDAFAPLLGLDALAGSASFDFDQIDLALGRINRIRIAGLVKGISLEQILQRWGNGSASGRLAIRVHNLDVEGDDIRSADVQITAIPPEGEPGTIDRTLLLGVAERLFDFSWPSGLPQRLLPEHLEYTEFGMRLLVQDNQLRILGTHGANGDTILTLRVFGKPFGLVKEQSGVVDLGPHIADLLRRIRSYDPARVREWWEAQGGG
jgi:hypothetical protein